MVALVVTVMSGIPVVVDNDAPPAQRLIAACTSEAAASLVLLALQTLAAEDPDLLTVPLVDERAPLTQPRVTPADRAVDATKGDAQTTRGGAEQMNSAQRLVYEQVRRLRGLRPLADAASVAAHFALDVDDVEAIWRDDGPRAA